MMVNLSIEKFRLKFAFGSMPERIQFFDFVKRCTRSLPDDGTDCFVKRELVKLIYRLAGKLGKKSLQFTITWYEYQALKIIYAQFEIPDHDILAQVAFGKIDQALPLDLGNILS